jgi:hypothetical protein
MDEQALRESFAKRLRLCDTAGTRAFADAIARTDSLPCWGNMTDELDELCPGDADRILVFEACREIRHLSTLLLFIELNRDRPAVLAAMAKDAHRLPFLVQCALAATPEGRTYLVDARYLHPGAAELLTATDDIRTREHSVYAAHAHALRSHRARAPSSSVKPTEVPEATTPGDLP